MKYHVYSPFVLVIIKPVYQFSMSFLLTLCLLCNFTCFICHLLMFSRSTYQIFSDQTKSDRVCYFQYFVVFLGKQEEIK